MGPLGETRSSFSSIQGCVLTQAWSNPCEECLVSRRDGASVLTKAHLIWEGTEYRVYPLEGQTQGKWVTWWEWSEAKEEIDSRDRRSLMTQIDRVCHLLLSP